MPEAQEPEVDQRPIETLPRRELNPSLESLLEHVDEESGESPRLVDLHEESVPDQFVIQGITFSKGGDIVINDNNTLINQTQL